MRDGDYIAMLKDRLKRAAKGVLDRFDFSLVQRANFRVIAEKALTSDRLPILELLGDEELRQGLGLVARSPSQLGQDIIALKHLDWKREGFFVDFGATNGHTLSNSWLLEKEFGWSGILAEPGRMWRKALAGSGRSAAIEFDCVWDKSDEVLTFSEIGELSTISMLADQDFHASARQGAKTYKVKTISLNDLLSKHRAPPVIDFLSIDTEGSEFRILAALDFSRYRFNVIACEHNYSSDREKIHQLLTGHGYVRKFVEHSLFDDWYFFDPK